MGFAYHTAFRLEYIFLPFILGTLLRNLNTGGKFVKKNDIQFMCISM